MRNRLWIFEAVKTYPAQPFRRHRKTIRPHRGAIAVVDGDLHVRVLRRRIQERKRGIPERRDPASRYSPMFVSNAHELTSFLPKIALFKARTITKIKSSR